MLIEAKDIMADRDQYVLIDTRSKNKYTAGHIPGALSLNVYDFILEKTDQDGIQKLVEFLRQSFAPLANDQKRRIVFYENISGMRAARGLWFLQFAGNSEGAVLNGGLQAWRKEGGKLETNMKSPEKSSFLYPVEMNTSILATYEDVLTSIDDKNVVIVDSRGLPEYKGLTVDPCCTIKGRIPGAVHFNWEVLIDHEGKLFPKSTIKSLANKHGIIEDKVVIVYCHRGARSASTALALRTAGFPNVKNYIGSWHEWTRQPNAPIEK